MPHELTMRADGTAEMVSYLETPWHKLGKVVDFKMTDEDVIKQAGLDWQVTEHATLAATSDQTVLMPGFKSLLRGDNNHPLAVVSKHYRTFQNHEMIQLMRGIAGKTEIVWESAGSLRGGSTVWALGRLPELTIDVAGTDKTYSYMLITNGHGNKRALTIMPTLVRTICSNTIKMALGSNEAAVARRASAVTKDYSDAALAGGYNIHHNRGLDKSVEGVVNAYANIILDKQYTEEIFNTMASKTITREESIDYWTAVFQLDKPLEDEALKVRRDKAKDGRIALLERIVASPTGQVAGTTGTLYNAFQAAIEVVDHHPMRRVEASKQLYNANFGLGATVKERAFEEALALV